MYCEGKTYSGKPCIYRASCEKTNLCGIHKFAGGGLNEMQKVLPFIFNKPIYSTKTS